MGERDENVEDEVVNDTEEASVDEAPADEEVAEEAEVVELDPHAELKAQLEAAQARLRTVSKAYTDLQKEMAAFRERMENVNKAKAERQAFETVKAMLDPVQNLKRSLEMGGDADSMRGGVEMVHKQFMAALEQLGLKNVPGQGCDFDPTYHEALAVMPVADAEQDGKVLQVHRDGYAVNGKVLQAAQVVIGKHEAPAEA